MSRSVFSSAILDYPKEFSLPQLSTLNHNTFALGSHINLCLFVSEDWVGRHRSWQLTNDLWRPFPLHCVAERMACWTAWVLVKNGRKCLSQQETVNCGSNFGKVTTAFCKRKRRNFWSARTEKSDVSWIITQLLYKCYTAKWNNRLDDVKL